MFTGADKPEIQELPRISERLSFIYLEDCKVSREDSGLVSVDKRGSVSIPAASTSVILLGPGTTITHRAMELIGDMGSSVIWVGEKGIRMYAHGKPLTHSSHLLMAQATAVSNTRSRLAVARAMYQMRFPEEDVSHLTMQQLRGREGSRVRNVYRSYSRTYGVEWNGRNYDHTNYSASDPINQALSTANSCLYGIIHSVIVALGCSPGLGFVHTGHERSFVYDVADLYKAETSIPVAFQVVASGCSSIGPATRRRMRDTVASSHLMDRVAKDIRRLLLKDTSDSDDYSDSLSLWDDKSSDVPSGYSYHSEDEDG